MGKRSNGCITCRKRKVKCDEAKPVCLRCRKATYNCKGYDQPWFDEAPFEALAQQRAAEAEKERQGNRYPFTDSEGIRSHGILPRESLVRDMNLLAFKEDICRSFVLHKLSGGAQYSKAMSWWLSPSPKVEIQARTLVSASKAMAATFFGRVHQQPSITTEGSRLYIEALHNLNKDLSHPVKALAFETLGATMALHMYELVNLTAGTVGWITHAGGVGRLIEARGPELHKTYPEKSLYLETRMLLVCNGVYFCQRTFIDEQKWKDVPWDDDPDPLAKTPFDYIVDVLSDVPYFLQEIMPKANNSGLPTPPDSPPQPDLARLQSQLLDRLEKLKELHGLWLAEYPTPVWTTTPKPGSLQDQQGGLESPFDTVLYFSDMSRAKDFCTHTATLILVMMLYEQVSRELDPSLPYPHPVLQTLLPWTSLQQSIYDIFRCTEYLFLDDHGSRGYIIFMFPATVAYFASDKSSSEAKWLRDVCKRNAASSGFGFGDFAFDYAMPLSFWMDDHKRRYQPVDATAQSWTGPSDQDNTLLLTSS